MKWSETKVIGMPGRLRMAMLGLAVAVGLGLFSGMASAHGVGYQESDLRPVALDFFYSTGELMSYLKAEVFSPSDEKIAYQSGRTDAGGRFAFVPDKPGKWRVVVNDDDGHRAEAEIDVTQGFMSGGAAGGIVQEKKAAPEGLDLYLRAGLGVSLLFNIAAFVLLFRRRRTV